MKDPQDLSFRLWRTGDLTPQGEKVKPLAHPRIPRYLRAMTLPDRLSTDPKSPHFNAELLQQGVRIVFNGKERTDVAEYCVSEGWVRVEAGKSKDRFGNPMTLKLKGKVEPLLTE
jgi:hypothetical protein